jgi:cyd operon protein YbgT
MWYFSWMLGLGLACAFAILNAIWYELHSDDLARLEADNKNPPR